MESLHVPVTTQLYFKDDPFIAVDPWASRREASTIRLKQDPVKVRLLTPKNAAFVIIDYQPVQVNSSSSLARRYRQLRHQSHMQVALTG